MNNEKEKLDIQNEDPVGYEKTVKFLQKESNLIIPDKEKFFQLIHKINAEKTTYTKLHPTLWQRSEYYFKMAVPVFLLVLIVTFIGVGNSITKTKQIENNKDMSKITATEEVSSLSSKMTNRTVKLEPTQAQIKDVVNTLKTMNEDEVATNNNLAQDIEISNWSGETKNMIMTTYYENSF